MKVALLSDIHSNKYALKEALKLLDSSGAEKCFVLGDMFGYYPWAKESYELLRSIRIPTEFILGNHDELLIANSLPEPLPEYYPVLLQNRNDLPGEALNWLRSLSPKKEISLPGKRIKLFHGTPDNPLNGRYYPDDEYNYDWFPKDGEIILLGHTHYPLVKKIGGGLIINPGSVGQPRKRGSKCSFMTLETVEMKTALVEFQYDVVSTIHELEEMQWYPRAIESLKKIL